MKKGYTQRCYQTPIEILQVQKDMVYQMNLDSCIQREVTGKLDTLQYTYPLVVLRIQPIDPFVHCCLLEVREMVESYH